MLLLSNAVVTNPDVLVGVVVVVTVVRPTG